MASQAYGGTVFLHHSRRITWPVQGNLGKGARIFSQQKDELSKKKRVPIAFDPLSSISPSQCRSMCFGAKAPVMEAQGD